MGVYLRLLKPKTYYQSVSILYLKKGDGTSQPVILKLFPTGSNLLTQKIRDTACTYIGLAFGFNDRRLKQAFRLSAIIMEKPIYLRLIPTSEWFSGDLFL